MSFEQILLVPGFDGLSFNQALALLAPYSPRLAFNFEQPAGNLWTDTARTTPVTTLGQSIGGVTNRVTGATVHAAQASGSKQPIWSSFTAASGKTVYGARADGTDDSWQVSSFDLSDTDEVTVIAGVRALAHGDMILEHGTGVLNRAFYLFFGSDRVLGFNFFANGTAPALAGHIAGKAESAPISAVVSATGDISGDINKIWVNNTLGTNATIDQSSGNFSNFTLNIGQRNASSIAFDGWYAPWLFICGDIVPDAIHQKIAKAMAKKLGLSI